MENVSMICDVVSVNHTKDAAITWSDSQWIPSTVEINHGMCYVFRTKRITPRTFKQHNHG